MIGAASQQLAEILDTLSLAARIQDGRWEPNLQTLDALDLARMAVTNMSDGDVAVSGDGAPISVDEDALRAALRDFATCALRHGGLNDLELVVAANTITISPIVEVAAPVDSWAMPCPATSRCSPSTSASSRT